ncbi:MAG: IS701 family transposase [Thermoplasmata archaeon]
MSPPRRRRAAPSLSRLQAHVQRIGIGGRFRDTPRERRRRALALQYTLGLLFPGERKSMQPVASRVPEARYESIQNFITDSPWDWKESQSRLIDEMKGVASGRSGLLVIDDVPLPKQGKKSPGVSKQYSGVRGSVDNCQSVVDCVYLLPRDGAYRETVGWCFALDLYLPRVWAEDPARCEEAGIPTPVVFQEKWRIALEQVDRGRRHGLPHEAVLGDGGYGDAQEFRGQLRAWKEPYVMEVTSSEVRVVPASTVLLEPGGRALAAKRGRVRVRPRLPPGITGISPKALAEEARDWVTVRYGQGTKGPLEGQFTRRKVRVCRTALFPTDEVGWLLLEKTEEGPRAWICWGLNKLRLQDLAVVARRRYLIERFHEEAKMELGMDHFEGRKWRGLNHHLTMLLIAHTFLVKEQLRSYEEEHPREEKAGTKEPVVLPTLAGMRRHVVIEVAWAMVSRVALDRTKKERVAWGMAVARYWAGAG